VHICPSPDGHIQAVGRDARGRKQYRYHSGWRTARDETKYERTVRFGRVLPAIRARVHRDLALTGLPREKMLATVERLLELTLIRVGNAEYARTNQSYGVTTLRNRHVKTAKNLLRFHFRGKSGVVHSVTIEDRRLARIVRECLHLPGQELFQYVDDAGQRHAIASGDVNAWLREVTEEDFTAEDFRIWGGTLLARRRRRRTRCWRSWSNVRRGSPDAPGHPGCTSLLGGLGARVVGAPACDREHLRRED
jgi:DNA topoisomerase-1